MRDQRDPPSDPALVGAPFEVIEAHHNVVHRFGDYVLVQQVGWGGHGVVYKAWHKPQRRFVALKFLHVGDAVAMQRFERETRVVAKLRHPHIVPLYEVGHFEGRAFMTMKLVDGHTLDRARLDTLKAIEVIACAADAVAHAHEQGIIHRDLKPANMMMGTDGHVYVMDFGLAAGLEGESKLTKTGMVNGTPSYMSPEHARGLACDVRSDVYSLGASLYELLGRRAPFEGVTAVVVLASVIAEEPLSVRHLNPNVTATMDAVVSKAMDKDPARRYQTAAAFALDLRRLLRGEAVAARAPSAMQRGLRWISRHRLASAFVGFVLLGAATAGAALVFHAASMSSARAQAEQERRSAEEKLAQSLISAGDVLVSKGRLADAASQFEDAERVLMRLGQSPFAARLGLMVARQSGSVPLIAFRAHAATVTAVRFMPDGKRAVSTSEDGTARIWDVLTGKRLAEFRGHAGQVWGLAVSPDGNQLATGSHDGTIKLWNVATASLLHTFADHQAPVGALVFSADGKRLYSGAEDNAIRIWDLQAGGVEKVLRGHAGRIRGLALSRDGRKLASAGGDGSARIWDLSGGQTTVIHDLAPLFVVRFVAQDSKVIVAGQEGDLATWSLDGKLINWVDANRSVISDLAIAPEEELMASAGWDARTRIFALPHQDTVGQLESHDARVLGVDISPDGQFLINGDSEGQLRVFNLRAAASRTIARPSFSPVSVAFSRDGRLAASWHDSPKQVVIWDTETHLPIRRLLFEGQVQRVTFSERSPTLAVALQAGEAVLWNFATLDLHRWPIEPDAHAIAYAKNETKLWVGSPNALSVYDVSTGHGETLLRDYRPLRIATSKNDRFVATAGRDGRLGLWNAASEELVRWFDLGDSLISVAFSPDGSRLAVGSAIAGINLIDTKTGAVAYLTKGLSTRVFGVDISPNGKLMVSGGSDRTLRLWDVDSGVEIRALPDTAYAVSNTAFSDDGRIFVGEEDGSFVAWDPKVAPAFDHMSKRVDVARARIQAGEETQDDWRTLGDWFASRHVCTSAVECYRAARARGWLAASDAFARCLWGLGHQDQAKVELAAAVAAQLLPQSYAALLASGPPLSSKAGALPPLRLPR